MSELSEEEIIKNLKKIIDTDNCWLEDKESADEDMIEWAELEKSAIQGLLDLFQKEKQKNKELEKDNQELKMLKNKLSIATAIALNGRKMSISKKSLNELNDMFSIEVEYRPFNDDYVFYAK